MREEIAKFCHTYNIVLSFDYRTNISIIKGFENINDIARIFLIC